MELHMHSHRLEVRAPDWTAAAVSGFVAGAALMVLEMLWSTNMMGATPWTMSHMIAAMVLGPDALQSRAFDVGIVAMALVIHYLLGMLFGIMLAAIIAPFHFDSSIGMTLLIGAVFGLALYMFNFYGMTRFFAWFVELRRMPTLLAHLIFGMVAAGMYLKLKRPIAAPILR